MENDRFNPLKMEQQEEFLGIAIRAALKSEKWRSPIPGTPEFTKALAEELENVLYRKCVDKVLYRKRTSPN